MNNQLMRQLCGAPDRVHSITTILEELNIPFALDNFERFVDGGMRRFTNVIVHPISNGVRCIWLMAHHDVMVPHFQNANDNTASIVNAILTRAECPYVGLVFTDGEEPPYFGVGAARFAARFAIEYNGPDGPSSDMVLNLELTGRGGYESVAAMLQSPEQWLSRESGSPRTPLYKALDSAGIPRYAVPMNDGAVLQRLGVDATCLFTCTDPKRRMIDFEAVALCHCREDTIGRTTNDADMADFRAGLIKLIGRLNTIS